MATGYGPSRRLLFDGDENKYEQWEIKFLGYMKLRNLKETLLLKTLPTDTVKIAVDAEKNEEAFAELIQYLDDRSLQLVMRDAVDDGRKALKILREHYRSSSKPKIISLYTELTSLRKDRNETVTDYLMRAESYATALKLAGENISDSLLIAMVIKGLPENFKPLTVVITQSDKKYTFTEFKTALRSFEETENCSSHQENDSIMKSLFRPSAQPQNTSSRITCYNCGKSGHKSFQCRSASATQKKKFCRVCKSHTHDEKFCRKLSDKHGTQLTYMSTYDEQDEEPENHVFSFKANFFNSSEVHDDWPTQDELLVDTGATSHICNDISKFESFDESFEPERHYIELADGTVTNNAALKKGTVVVNLRSNDGKIHSANLENTLYVPSYPQNIFSVRAATTKGSTATFGPHTSELTTPNGTKFELETRGKLYYLCSSKDSRHASYDLQKWHEILGHCNVDDVRKLESVVNGMKISDKQTGTCEVCIKGKQTQVFEREPDKRATAPLELVHTDLAGPISPTAKDEFRYAIIFVDDFSGFMFVYFLRQKNDAAQATKRFLADAAPYGKVIRLRSDNGTEFTCADFQNVLIENHIKHEKSSPHSPHQNGTAERGWRTLFEMARCLLINAKIPKQFWTYAVGMAAYIRNRCYLRRTKQTPFYYFTGNKPNISNMHLFGSICYGYENDKSKLNPRSTKGIFVGHDRYSPAYLLINPENGKVKKYRCVKFLDTFEVREETERQCTTEEKLNSKENGNDDDDDSVVHTQTNVDVPENRRYPQRIRSAPKRLITEDATSVTIDFCYKMCNVNVPQSYEEAMKTVDAPMWKCAMDEEMNSLLENDTFSVTTLPDDKSKIKGRWVYSTKEGPNGNISKYKARYVAKGYSQDYGSDYTETFSPTARMTSVRMLMQIAAQKDLLVHQMDVKSAYLNAPIDCEVYLEQPKGYETFSTKGEKMVYKLKKSLYGLKQSGRNWNLLLHNFLVENHFEQSPVDACLYTNQNGNDLTRIIIWVDDIIIAAPSVSLIIKVKEILTSKFKMTDLGAISYFLGIQFECQPDCIKMTQSRYIQKLLEKYQMNECKPRDTPGEQKTSDTTDLLSEEEALTYRQITGALIYIMTCTRPDICYAVTTLSRYLSCPTNEQMIALKHLLRYLKGTIFYGLCYRKNDDIHINGFCDADWASSSNDRRSISGYCFAIANGALISWRSAKQSVVALSTCEAEYIALAAAGQEAKFLNELLKSIDGHDYSPVTIQGDNQAALSLAKNPNNHKRSKHIDIKYHFIRHECSRKMISLVYIPTNENIADIFTKSATKQKLSTFRNIIFCQEYRTDDGRAMTAGRWSIERMMDER